MRASILLVGLVPVVVGVNVPNVQNPYHNQRATWGYQPSNGPLTWPTTYPSCDGTSQSPINIVTNSAVITDPGPIKLGGYDGAMQGTITNNEHTITFSYASGLQPYIYGGRLPAGDRFEFLQLHWHWGSVSTQGSEHTVDGKEYPAEVHLVHWNTKYADVSEAVTKTDGLAVLGFFYEVSSADNGKLDDMLSVVHLVRRMQRSVNLRNKVAKGSKAGVQSVTVPASIRLDQLLPSTGLPDEYCYYQGGLTTPTCDEVVLWTVFPTTVPISERQLNIFRTLTDSSDVTLSDNYRPPQPLNDRTLYKRSVTTSATDNKKQYKKATLHGAVAGVFAAAAIFGLVMPALGEDTRKRSLQVQPDGSIHHTHPDPAVFSGEWIKQVFG